MQKVDSPYAPHRPDSIGKAFLSFEAIAAIVCMMAFWMTLTAPPPELPGDKTPGAGKGDVDSPDLVIKALALNPVVLAKQGQFDKAQAAASELLNQRRHDVSYNIAKGNVLIISGAKEDGLDLLKKSVALAPRNRYVRMHYAEKLQETGRLDEALAQFQVVSKNYPVWVDPHMRMAQIYLKQDKNAEAATELGAVINVDSSNSAAYKMRGLALAKSGSAQAGMDEYVRGVQMESQQGLPQPVQVLVRDWGNVDRTIFELKQQIENRPDDYVPKLRLGQLYSYLGQARDAKEFLSDARRQAPNNSEVHRTLAVVLKKLGETNTALSEFQLSIALEKARLKEEQKAR